MPKAPDQELSEILQKLLVWFIRFYPKDFNDITELNAVQSFRLPVSGFSFNPLKAMQKIDAYDIKYKVNKIFEGNKEITPESLKLKQPDSIAVTASYSFPIAYDTLVISKSNLKEVAYKGTKIEIDKFDGKSAEISIPIEIGAKIIGQQGLTSDGVLALPVIIRVFLPQE